MTTLRLLIGARGVRKFHGAGRRFVAGRLKRGGGADRVVAIWLIPIVCLGAVLRFVSLPSRGFIYWDEGKFALEGIRLQSVLAGLPDPHPAMLAGKAVGTAKPMHALLIALSYAALGVHDYAPLLLNAAASVVEIVIVFLVGRQLFGARIGVVAAGIMSVSGYDIVYARSALSESDANLLFLVGFLLWWSLRTRSPRYPSDGRTPGVSLWPQAMPCLYGGVILGVAFTTNYRLSVYIATLILLDLLHTGKCSGYRAVAISSSAWLAGLVLAPLCWGLVGILAQTRGLILFRSEVTGRATSYLAEVWYQIHGGRHSALRFSPLPYLHWYLIRQGWPLSLLLLAGSVWAMVQRSFRWLVPVGLVFIPFVGYSFAPIVVPRNIDTILPFTAILSAGVLVSLLESARLTRIRGHLLLVAMLLLSLLGVVRAWPLLGVRSGFAQAANFLALRRSYGALVANEVMLFYLRDQGRGCDAPQIPTTKSALASDYRRGYDYAVIDRYSRPLTAYLTQHARVIARFPSFIASTLGEDLIASENGIVQSRRGPQYVSIYALNSLHIRRGEAAAIAPSCTLDRLG